MSATDILGQLIEEAVQRALRKAGPAGVQKRLYTVNEASEYLGMTEEAIRAKVLANQIPRVSIDRKLRFDKLDLDRWIEQHRTAEE